MEDFIVLVATPFLLRFRLTHVVLMHVDDVVALVVEVVVQASDDRRSDNCIVPIIVSPSYFSMAPQHCFYLVGARTYGLTRSFATVLEPNGYGVRIASPCLYYSLSLSISAKLYSRMRP